MDPKTFRKSIKISEKRNIEKIQFSRALDGYEGARVTSQEQLLWLRGVNDVNMEQTMDFLSAVALSNIYGKELMSSCAPSTSPFSAAACIGVVTSPLRV